MNYYYLAASLPMLKLDEAPGVTSIEFLALCAEHLAVADRDAMDALDDPTAVSGHRFVAAWRAVDTQLRNAVARARARRLRMDAGPYLREHEGFDPPIEKAVDEAFGAASPIDRERALDRMRWNLLDELAGLDEFAGSALLAYREKLRLAERWAAMDETRGGKTVDRMVAAGA